MPKKYLKRVERTGYGEFLFAEWKAADPDFVLNRPEYRQAKISGDRSQLRIRVVPRARTVGSPGLGIRRHCGSVIRRHLPGQLHEDRPSTGRIAREGSGMADGTGAKPILRPRSRSTFLPKPCRPTTGVPSRALRPGSRWTTTPSGVSRTASTTSGLTLRHTDLIDEFERSRPDFSPRLV